MKWVAVLLLVFGTSLAHAAVGKLSAPGNAKWKKECSGCHDAYPPQYLSADDWRQLMGRLNRHFGENATLDAETNKQILSFLVANASSGDLYSSASLRISDTPWFKHEHRVINPKEWVNPEVGSRSHCSACHGKVILGD
jgi:hypothetical protein